MVCCMVSMILSFMYCLPLSTFLLLCPLDPDYCSSFETHSFAVRVSQALPAIKLRATAVLPAQGCADSNIAGWVWWPRHIQSVATACCSLRCMRC